MRLLLLTEFEGGCTSIAELSLRLLFLFMNDGTRHGIVAMKEGDIDTLFTPNGLPYRGRYCFAWSLLCTIHTLAFELEGMEYSRFMMN